MLLASMIGNALTRLGVVAMLLLIACRGREPALGEGVGGGLERDAAILAARTLGLAYLRSEQLAQAETAFRKIVALAPDQALGFANLGLVQLRQGRYDEAEREIRRAAALDTASDDIALTLAKVYELTGRTAPGAWGPHRAGGGRGSTPWRVCPPAGGGGGAGGTRRRPSSRRSSGSS